MGIDPDRLRTGELLNGTPTSRAYASSSSPRRDVSGTTLHVRDVAIYPVGIERGAVGVAFLLRAARDGLFPAVRAAGFERLRVSGTRLSGARPGRIVDVTIDLEREAR